MSTHKVKTFDFSKKDVQNYTACTVKWYIFASPNFRGFAPKT